MAYILFVKKKKKDDEQINHLSWQCAMTKAIWNNVNTHSPTLCNFGICFVDWIERIWTTESWIIKSCIILEKSLIIFWTI